MKIDPYRNKEVYLKWKEDTKKRIPKISEMNSIFIKKYLDDMEMGFNVSKKNKKGSRSYTRLNTLRTRIILLAKMFSKRMNVQNITEIKEEQVVRFFSDMRNEKISKIYSKATKDKELGDKEVKIKIRNAKRNINNFYKKRNEIIKVKFPEGFNVDKAKLGKFLKILNMTPIMYWIAYKKAPNYNSKKCVLKNITTPMIDKMVQLFLRVK